MTTPSGATPPETGGNKVVAGIIGIVTLIGGCYLIWQCVKLFIL